MQRTAWGNSSNQEPPSQGNRGPKKQGRSQLPEEVRAALFGNEAILVAFRGEWTTPPTSRVSLTGRSRRCVSSAAKLISTRSM
jgi:hypothetical protein